MTSSNIPHVTVDSELGCVEVHDAAHLGIRFKGCRFRYDPDRNVWYHRYRNNNEMLTLLALLISQRLPLHENLEIKPKDLEMLKPCQVVRFVRNNGGSRAIVEEIE